MNKSILILGATALSVWTAAAEDVPKVGVFLGYEYVRFNSQTDLSNVPTTVPSFNGHGGGGQFIYNFNRWLGGVFDAGAVHNGRYGDFQTESTFINFLAGPRFSIRSNKHVTPYFQALFGGVYGTSSIPSSGFLDPSAPILNSFSAIPTGVPVSVRFVRAQTGFAMTAGGGIEVNISRHVVFRPLAVDYYMTKLRNLQAFGDNRQDNLRASAGFMFLIGGEKAAPKQPPPPATKTCPDGTVVSVNATCPKINLALGISAAASEVCQGDVTKVLATVPSGAANQLNFTWSVNGQAMAQGQSFQFGGTGRDPGTYKVKVTATGGAFNSASAETSITVLEYKPPSGAVTANPALIHAGETSALSANFTGQCGGPIQAPTFTASEGTVNGDRFDSTGVVFDPANKSEQRKTVAITAKAADNKGIGTATTTIDVVKSPVVAPIRLPDVLFPKNSARVNNCGKRILLEQLNAYYQRDSTGTVVLVGHQSSDETAADLARQRALNAAAVITAGTGVCLSIPQSQVQVSSPGVEQNGVPFEPGFCQASVGGRASNAEDERRVVVWFVPTGGQIPASVTNNQAATSLPVSSLGCPK
uniref:Outer membrane protein beta-barrel domain-containing protein n=1 Tax=Solibacter usitatus (strain Ellin6076) TaxID=234267 RepID=Q01RK6_SOLUE